ncbi:MAG TPA: Wzz/FepE/Etk N-terminal domain-containing protein, partial [Pseudomonadales bacterium]
MSGAEEKKTPQAAEQYQAVLLSPDQFYARHTEDEIDLKELWQAVWQGKWIIVATTLFCATIAVVISLSLPNIYQSSATLISSAETGQSDVAALAARSGGLVSIPGVNPGFDKTKVAVETLKSRAFLSQFIEKHNLKAEIFGIKSWDEANNKLIFDENIYNEQTKTWQWKTSSNWKKEQQPSDQEAVKELLENINVNLDKDTGIVEITAL